MSWHGSEAKEGLDLTTIVKVSRDITKAIAGGIEYYADYGNITNIAGLHNRQQQIFPAIELNVSLEGEIDFGIGAGPAAVTDHWIAKGIIGRRFNWGRARTSSRLRRTACRRSP